MLYQKILDSDAPYSAHVSKLTRFIEHRHADIEIHYCISGSMKINVDKKDYVLQKGDVILINSMVSHQVPDNEDNEDLVIIVGPTLLKKHFSLFSSKRIHFPVCSLYENNDDELLLALNETVDLCKNGQTDELMTIGNIYRICALLLAKYDNPTQDKNQDLRTVQNVDKALDLIYYHYFQPVTVDDAASATGYGKSNFCKIFKNIIGETFHSLLNKQRVSVACTLLRQTNMSISEISQEVGFSETKTFCRIFRSLYGCSPGQYRKEKSN